MAFAKRRLLRAGWVSFTPCKTNGTNPWPNRYNNQNLPRYFISDIEDHSASREAIIERDPSNVIDISKCIVPQIIISRNKDGDYDPIAKMDETLSCGPECYSDSGDSKGFRLHMGPNSERIIFFTKKRPVFFLVLHKQKSVFGDRKEARSSQGESCQDSENLIEINLDNPTKVMLCRKLVIAVPSRLSVSKYTQRIQGVCSGVTKVFPPAGFVHKYSGEQGDKHSSQAVYDQLILR
jgi:hypothetical protein